MIKNKKIETKITSPGVFSSSSTSSLKSIANKPMEAYSKKNIPQTTIADQKRKKAEAEMSFSKFRAQPFVSPISGHRKTKPVEIMVAHGMYDQITGKVVHAKEPVFLTKEVVAAATFTLTDDISRMLANQTEDTSQKSPLQGRLLFSTSEGDFEIDANLIRINLEDNTTRTYHKTIEDAVRHQPHAFKKLPPNQELFRAEEIVNDKEDSNEQSFDLDLNHHQVDIVENQEFKVSQAEVEDVSKQDTSEIESPVVTVENSAIFPDDFYYEMPSLEILDDSTLLTVDDEDWIEEKMTRLEIVVDDLNISTIITGDYLQGPVFTRFDVLVQDKSRLNHFFASSDDLKKKMDLSYLNISPISNKKTIGIELENDKKRILNLKDYLKHPDFILHDSPLRIATGQDIEGKFIFTDILTTPHMLVAGSSIEQISEFIHSVLISILFTATPETARLLLIDSAKKDFDLYKDIPHLATPIINSNKLSVSSLRWAVSELDRRYESFVQFDVRNVLMFNKKRLDFEELQPKMPYIVIVVRELADIENGEVLDLLTRLTKEGHTVGIHLIIATSSINEKLLTSDLKAQISSRVAFAVKNANDSRLIIETNGAESLLPNHDMLVGLNGQPSLLRLTSPVVSKMEIERVVDMVKSQVEPRYLVNYEQLETITTNPVNVNDLTMQALDLIISENKASTSMLQRKLGIGYVKAAKIIDKLENSGYISAPNGALSKRDVLISREEFEQF